MTTLEDMKGIGPKSAQWLKEAGIETYEDLEQLGSVEAYRRVKALYPDRVSLNMLWGLEAALAGIAWHLLPDDVKADLLAQLEAD